MRGSISKVAMTQHISNSDEVSDPRRGQLQRGGPPHISSWLAWLARRAWWVSARRAALVALVSAAALGGAGAVQRSLPGEPLYPLKRSGEAVRLQIDPMAVSRARIHLALADERAQEALRLAARHEPVDVSLLRDLTLHYRLAAAEIQQLPPAEAWDVRQSYRDALQEQLAALSTAPPAADAWSRAVIVAMVELSREELVRVAGQEPIQQR